MSEWSIEHAWKSDPFTRADAQQTPPTPVRSISSRYNELLCDTPVSDDVHRGFRGVCDTVWTQSIVRFARTHIEEYSVVRRGGLDESVCEWHTDLFQEGISPQCLCV